jgi:integrase
VLEGFRGRTRSSPDKVNETFHQSFGIGGVWFGFEVFHMASIREKLRADGSYTFHVQVRVKGTPPVTKTFDRKTDAKRWAEQTETAIRQRRYFSVFEAQRHTAAQMIERFIQDVLPNRPKQRRDLTSHLTWWKSEIGAHLLSELTPSVLSAARDKLSKATTVRKKKRAPATVLRIMASLSAVLKVAERDWQWIESSPMAKISKPKAGRGRVRYLSTDERNRLLAACEQLAHPYLPTIVVLALSTGMRLGEILGMRWELVDVRKHLAIGHAQLLETKNGERRSVAIAGAALAAVRALAAREDKSTGYLFPSTRPRPKTKEHGERPVDIRRPWNEAAAKANLKDFRFHDLRHSAASYLAMNGATASEIAAVLGHKTLALVKRYAHLSESHTASVVARMNEQVFGQGEQHAG